MCMPGLIPRLTHMEWNEGRFVKWWMGGVEVMALFCNSTLQSWEEYVCRCTCVRVCHTVLTRLCRYVTILQKSGKSVEL